MPELGDGAPQATPVDGQVSRAVSARDEGRELPVLAVARPIEPVRERLPLPVAAAAAAGGFALGVGAFLLVRSLRLPLRLLRSLRRGRRRRRKVEIAASRSVLVDIHFLRER
ncbi:hypothetical protein JDY09_08115 [Thermoleophilum album]|uniref:hypothetical protein n=1 Tax=Thermoleophilum album TaxID=29539 RepID=UPI00237CE597|nr:hypothetical protein [Thermoleophilum album]WDT93345.1 hypothetical protein JDY09_08115 [Thermoleophilum album]